MRTNIEIDDLLLSRAMAASGLSTKRATVEEGLRLLVRMRRQAKALADLKGLGMTLWILVGIVVSIIALAAMLRETAPAVLARGKSLR